MKLTDPEETSCVLSYRYGGGIGESRGGCRFSELCERGSWIFTLVELGSKVRLHGDTCIPLLGCVGVGAPLLLGLNSRSKVANSFN